MLKDKFVLSIIGITILIMTGAVFYFSKIESSAPANSNGSTPVSEEKQKLLEVVADDYIKGNKDATVTLVEYLDFECEACGAYYPLVKQLSEEFKNDVRFVNRYFPLPGHKNGMPAALAVEAAAKQGKYWEMHNLLFDNQKSWGEKQSPDPAIFEVYAQQVGLNMDQYKKDVKSKEVSERVNRDKTSGTQLGVNGTPSFFLNGEKIPNPKTIEDFKTFIQAAILKAPKPSTKPLGEKVHEHADFKVILSGKAFDFSQAKYQSSEDNPLDPDAHSHDGIGNVTHKHRKGVTIGDFFKSLGMTFDNSCFITDDNTKYCSDDTNTLKFLVNGKSNDEYGNYEFTDLDKLLISYGPKDENVTKQINLLSDDACMYSEKCPERGKPPTENCVGGLGTDCQ
jgi:protein-disulfide isomerase